MTSPVGPLTIWGGPSGITALDWVASDPMDSPDFLRLAKDQLQAYFAGTLQAFDLPLAANGSPFQQNFYAALCAIPYGETRTYGDLAKQLGVSAQAIGQACGANPIPIIVPCHRVLGATGLGGFSGAGGVEAKVQLLKLEGAGSLLI